MLSEKQAGDSVKSALQGMADKCLVGLNSVKRGDQQRDLLAAYFGQAMGAGAEVQKKDEARMIRTAAEKTMEKVHAAMEHEMNSLKQGTAVWEEMQWVQQGLKLVDIDAVVKATIKEYAE